MKTKTKVIIAVIVVVVLLIFGFAFYWETHHGNRQLVDWHYRFNYGVIRLPNGEVVEGKVSSWYDYPDSDAVQLTINGKTYLTHYANVALVEN